MKYGPIILDFLCGRQEEFLLFQVFPTQFVVSIGNFVKTSPKYIFFPFFLMLLETVKIQEKMNWKNFIVRYLVHTEGK